MDKAQSPLLAWPVERVARPAAVVCLRCRGWVGVRPQGFVFQGSSVLVPARRNRAGVGLRGGAAALGLFSLLLVQFFGAPGCLLRRSEPWSTIGTPAPQPFENVPFNVSPIAPKVKHVSQCRKY